MKRFSNSSSIMLLGIAVSSAAFLLTAAPLQALPKNNGATTNKPEAAPAAAEGESSVVVLQDYQGTVVEIKTMAAEQEVYGGSEAIVKIGKDNIDVYLGPTAHMEKQGFQLQKGDKLSIKGAKVTIVDKTYKFFSTNKTAYFSFHIIIITRSVQKVHNYFTYIVFLCS